MERLLERHRRSSRPWFPHELVPWERARDTPPGSQTERIPAGVRSALVLNVLTEDNLPFYVTGLHERFGDSAPWWDWLRQWAAEEARHATVLRDYLLVTGVVDPAGLERDRMAHVLAASVPRSPSTVAALVYLAAQELATRVAHHRTGEALDDAAGRRVMARVAADENLHFLFYRDLVRRRCGSIRAARWKRSTSRSVTSRCLGGRFPVTRSTPRPSPRPGSSRRRRCWRRCSSRSCSATGGSSTSRASHPRRSAPATAGPLPPAPRPGVAPLVGAAGQRRVWGRRRSTRRTLVIVPSRNCTSDAAR